MSRTNAAGQSAVKQRCRSSASGEAVAVDARAGAGLREAEQLATRRMTSKGWPIARGPAASREALEIRQKLLGLEHRDTVTNL